MVVFKLVIEGHHNVDVNICARSCFAFEFENERVVYDVTLHGVVEKL